MGDYGVLPSKSIFGSVSMFLWKQKFRWFVQVRAEGFQSFVQGMIIVLVAPKMKSAFFDVLGANIIVVRKSLSKFVWAMTSSIEDGDLVRKICEILQTF